jgi:hypothetical protein
VLSLVVWDGVVGERGWVYIYSFLLSKYGDLMKIFFIKLIPLFFWVWKSFNTKKLFWKFNKKKTMSCLKPNT